MSIAGEAGRKPVEGNRAWQYSDAERRRARWTMTRIALDTRRRQLASASVRRRGK